VIKLASLATALVSRGVHERTAQFAADMGMSVLRMASEGWITDNRRPFAAHLRSAAEELRRIADQVTSDGGLLARTTSAGAPLPIRLRRSRARAAK
jgi:hypothetical protein